MAYGLLAFIVFVAFTLAYGHLLRRRRAPRAPHILALWLGGAAALPLMVFAVEPAGVPLAVSNVAVYLLLGEAYVFVYVLPIGSLSVRILVTMLELESHPNERTLLAYSPESFLKVRLESLVAQGLLEEAGGRYRITPRGRRWARAGVLVKKLLAVGPGG